ncbi:MAG TPA: methyltransferase domain-containing protein [Caulobacteraceae bacterium]|jgi:trans-aconitate 2-methyltransferase|nr:methyltransferase domain-containing protein [Caulobacteraceae bacterium]
MPSWDPDIYERFKAYRDRPALDLLLRVPGDLDPREIWDLGCGTGEHAAVLARRHPGARVHGLDSSAEMLERAHARETSVDWVQADLAGFAPDTPPDLIFANAALQWVPDHAALIPRLASVLAEQGVFACQMPAAYHEPWHQVLRDLADEAPWAALLRGVDAARPIADAGRYYTWLAPLCRQIDIWTTTYLHVLDGEDPVMEWMRGTALRPYLDALTDPIERDGFLEAYRKRVRAALPARDDGTTLFPFPRLFIVARQ